MFNLSNLKAVQKANLRKNTVKRGQNFEFKFRRSNTDKKGIDSKFIVSDELWARLNLDADFGLIELHDEENNTVYLGVVSNDDAVFCRKTEKGEKGKAFKNTVMEGHLVSAGLLPETEEGNVFFDVTVIAEDQDMSGVMLHKVLQLSISETASDEIESEEEENVNEEL